MRKLSAISLGLILVCSSCVVSVARREPFRQIAGTRQTLKREALLFHLSSESAHQRGVFYHLYDKREDSNAWRKEGWLPVGTVVEILEVNRYLTDARGRWIGVVGLVEDPATHQKVKFIYCWSRGPSLVRAPWEDPGTPEHRELPMLR